MATDKLIGDALLTKSFEAEAAVTANRFVTLVSQTGPKPTVQHSADQEQALGVARDDYRIGDQVDVVMIGTAFVTTAENITAGQPIGATTDGKANVASTGDHVCGLALADANSGDPVLVLLTQGGIY